MKRRAFLQGLGAAGGLAFAPTLGAAAPAARGRAVDRLRDAKIQIGSRIRMIETGPRTGSVDVELGAGRSARRARHGASAHADARWPSPGNPTRSTCCRPSKSGSASLDEHSVTLGFDAWSRDNYVVLPGALLRRQSLPVAPPAAYPPLLTEPADIGPHVPPIVPEIPRLTRGAGPLVVRRRHGQPGDARPRNSRAGAPRLGIVGSPDRRLRRLVLDEGERRPDARHRHRRRIGDPEPGVSTLRRQRQDPPLRPGRGPGGARRRDPGARPRVRLRRRSGAVRTNVCAAQGPHRADRAGSRPAVLRGVRRPRDARERPLGRKARLPRGRRSLDGVHDLADRMGRWAGDDAAADRSRQQDVPRARVRDHRVRARRAGRRRRASSMASPTARPGTTTVSCRRVSAAPPPPRAPRPQPVVYKHARRWHLVRRSAETLTLLVKQLALLERQPELRGGAASDALAGGGAPRGGRPGQAVGAQQAAGPVRRHRERRAGRRGIHVGRAGARRAGAGGDAAQAAAVSPDREGDRASTTTNASCASVSPAAGRATCCRRRTASRRRRCSSRS